MRILERRKGVHVVALVAAIALGSCGGGSPSHPLSDGGSGQDGGAGQDAGSGQDGGAGQDAGSEVTCEQQQRDYVNRVLASKPQTDVAATVHAVLGAPDFLQAMPYCSGPRPGARSVARQTSRWRL